MSEFLTEGPGLNAGSFVAKAIEEGLSMRKTVDLLRESGMKMGNQAFRSLYANVRDTIADRDQIAGLNYDAVPPAEAFGTWAADAEGGFATFVTSFTRMPGEVEMEQRFYIHVSDDPHTPQEAIDAAAAHYTDDAVGSSGTPQGVYQGSVVTSVTRTRGTG